MSIFKGRLSSSNKFTANDDIRALEIIGVDSVPAQLVLQTGEATPASWYLWIDSSDNLRMNEGTAPTSATQGSAGSVVTGAANAGANRTLSNLGTTAIAAHVLTATDSTYNLGGTNYWANAYIDKVYVHSAATIAGGAADRIDFVGDEYHGVDGAGATVTWSATTSGSKLVWDDTGNTNEGTLTFTDDAQLIFGDSADMLFEWTGNAMHIDASTDDYVLNFGATKDLDIIFHGKAGDDDAGWDASVETFQIMDNAIFHIGGTSIGSQLVGFKFIFDGNATLNIDAITAEDSITIGENTSTDFELHGTLYDIHWDASVDDLIFGDSVGIVVGGSADLRLESNGTVVNATFGTTTNSLVLAAYAAQTVPAFQIDGATATWNGADDKGMLHLNTDAAMAHAGASLLQVVHATTAPINSAQGFLARFVDTAAVAATPPAYIVEMDSTNNFGLHIVTGKATSSNLVMSGLQAQTVSMVVADGSTGTGWTGADDVGMVHLKGKVAGANKGSSLLQVVHATGQPVTAAEGFLARFVSTGTARTDGYAVGIQVPATQPALFTDGIVVITGQDACGASLVQITGNDTANTSALDIHNEGTAAAVLITCDDVDSLGLSLVGKASQTTSLAKMDGSAGAGWLGAAGVGMLQLDNDGTYADVAASMLLITNSGVPVDDSRGHCLRIVDTGNAAAGTNAFAAYISASDATVEALFVDAGEVWVDEYVVAGTTANAGGLVTACSSTDLHNTTPTNAQLDTAFGATALAHAGFIGVAMDSSQTLPYIVVSDGTDWFYTPILTKAV